MPVSLSEVVAHSLSNGRSVDASAYGKPGQELKPGKRRRFRQFPTSWTQNAKDWTYPGHFCGNFGVG